MVVARPRRARGSPEKGAGAAAPLRAPDGDERVGALSPGPVKCALSLMKRCGETLRLPLGSRCARRTRVGGSKKAFPGGVGCCRRRRGRRGQNQAGNRSCSSSPRRHPERSEGSPTRSDGILAVDAGSFVAALLRMTARSTAGLEPHFLRHGRSTRYSATAVFDAWLAATSRRRTRLRNPAWTALFDSPVSSASSPSAIRTGALLPAAPFPQSAR